MIEKRTYRYGQKREPVDAAIWQLLWLLNRVLRPRGLSRLNVVSLHYDNERTALVVVLDTPHYRLLRLEGKPGAMSLTLVRKEPTTGESVQNAGQLQSWEGLTEEALKRVLIEQFGIASGLAECPADPHYPILSYLN